MKKEEGFSLKVMPDFASSGVWNNDSGVMVHHEDISITKALTDEFVQWINKLADAHDEIDAEEIVSVLNEDRMLAGFSSVADVQHIELELAY